MVRFRPLTAVAVCLLSLSLTQCAGEPTVPEVVVQDLVAPVTAATVAAVTGTTFTLAGAGGVLGSAYAGQTVALTFSSSTAATFVVAGQTLTSTVTYGSCIFTFSNAPSGVTNPLTVNPCAVTYATAGQSTGTATTTTQTLTFGSTTSAPVAATVTVAENGTVTVTSSDGTAVAVGTATTTTATGSV